MRQHDGMTLDEFADLCTEIRPGPKYELSFRSNALFLERCCEVGLLTRNVGEDEIVRYSPTPLLRYVFTGDDD